MIRKDFLLKNVSKLMQLLRCEPYLNSDDAETLNDIIDFLKTTSDIASAIDLLNTTYLGIVDTPHLTRSSKLIAIRQLIRLKKYQRLCAKS